MALTTAVDRNNLRLRPGSPVKTDPEHNKQAGSDAQAYSSGLTQ
ncbi:hypothetical protein [Acidihalobacter prosperus]